MKLPIACMKCAMTQRDVSPSNFTAVEFRDDGRYQTTCSKGHISIVLLQEQKFELLFDIGAYATQDGYYREAVTSFTASLERFYEFFIKAVLFGKSIDDQAVQRSMKFAKLSERQLGGFIFLYTSEFRKSPILLENRKMGSHTAVEFRNEVVHRGKIPSSKEALEYGQIILELIKPVLLETKQKYQKGVQATIFEHLKEGKHDPKELASTMTMPTIINLSREDEGWNKRSLEQAIKELKRW